MEAFIHITFHYFSLLRKIISLVEYFKHIYYKVLTLIFDLLLMGYDELMSLLTGPLYIMALGEYILTIYLYIL